METIALQDSSLFPIAAPPCHYTFFKTIILKNNYSSGWPECTSHNNQQSTMQLPFKEQQYDFFLPYVHLF